MCAMVAVRFSVGQAGQAGGTTAAGGSYFASADLQAKGEEVSKQAKASPNGSGNLTLEKYPGHFINITARVKSGGAELHQHYNDIFVVLDGEVTEITGGTIPDMKLDTATGEGHGAAVVGGTEHKLVKGDVLHISANTPHQSIMSPGKTFTAIVIKVHQD
jgi:mannose-6-phosphate isomerase-like protein (cupin superfamily)